MRKLAPGILAFALLAAGPARAFAAEAQVSGTVVSETGAPIEGAALTVTSPNFPSFNRSAKTDAKGHFSMNLGQVGWDYTVRIEKAGFAPTLAQFHVPVGRPVISLSATLHPPPAAPSAPPVPAADAGVVSFNQGVDLLQKGDRAGAEKKFNEAVASRPNLAPAWKALAQLALERKDYARALASGRKSLEADPSQKDLFGLLMKSAQATGDSAAAEDYRKRYLDANANNPEVIYNSGVDQMNARDYHSAAAAFAKVIQLKRDWADAYFWLAVCQFNLKRLPESRAMFRRYLELAPQGANAAAARDMLKGIPER